MPRETAKTNDEGFLALEKKKPGQWWSSFQTSLWRKDAIERAISAMNNTFQQSNTSTLRLMLQKDLRRKWEVRLSHPMRFNRSQYVILSCDTLLAEISTCIWPLVRESEEAKISWVYRHYGSWKDNYNLSLQISVYSMDLLRQIFGEPACEPRRWHELGKYSESPAKGPVRGGRLRIMASQATPFVITVRFVHSLLCLALI